MFEMFYNNNNLIKKNILIFIIMSICVSCSYFNRKFGLKDDNVIEANIENIIENNTGLSIDLTPENPDNDDYSLDIWRED